MRFSRRNFITLSAAGMASGAVKNNFDLFKGNDKIPEVNLNTENQLENTGSKRVLKLHSKDNVAVALENLEKGTTAEISGRKIILAEDVRIKHKFTLTDLKEGDPVILYGITVGRTVKPVKTGYAVTIVNTVNATDAINRDTAVEFKWTPPDVSAFREKSFMGYHRPDGQVGTANYWLVVPLVFCENRVAMIIKEAVTRVLGYEPFSQFSEYSGRLASQYRKENSSSDKMNNELNLPYSGNRLFRNVSGIQFLTHGGGCGETRQDSEELCGLLACYITHPNVAGATVLSLGCQNAQLSILQREIRKRDPGFSKPYFEFEQQSIGTEDQMIKQAIDSIYKGMVDADRIERKPAPLSKLCIALKCGGSDGFSGISANPAIGHTSDILTALGGTTVLAEFPELSGVEQELYNRCSDRSKGEKFLQLMQKYNERAKSLGSGFENDPSPGNIRDGLITDAMKSAGAAKKGGTSPVNDVLDYTEKVSASGLNLLCSPGNDGEAMTAQVASGANIVLFTTGLGTPTGNPVVPVIKISTNSQLSEKMPDIIDINTGTIIDGSETIERAGERILDYVIEVASGNAEPAAVRNRQTDFLPWKRGISL